MTLKFEEDPWDGALTLLLLIVLGVVCLILN